MCKIAEVFVTNDSQQVDSAREESGVKFVKWLDAATGLIQSAPPETYVAGELVDISEILSRLARTLGYIHAPVECRTETISSKTDRGRELHERKWYLGMDPCGNRLAERFSGSVSCP